MEEKSEILLGENDPIISFVKKLILPCVRDKDECTISLVPAYKNSCATVIVSASDYDMSKLIGRKGITADAFRAAANAFWKCNGPKSKFYLKFESNSRADKTSVGE
ncbi:MAG: hypothetical protein K5694_03155 [Bacilli bacterium]|nr:hypothetical protein [Bacilli bacterium]